MRVNSDEKKRRNRECVRKHRMKKKIKLIHERAVRERIDALNRIDSPDEDVHKIPDVSPSIESVSDFNDQLRFWAVNHRITARAINDLLKILILAGFSSLPRDSRTFMRTPRSLKIKACSNGKMWYNGLKKNIETLFSNVNRQMTLTLDFNFDGLPVFKSSNLQFWPLLAAIEGSTFNQ